MSFNTDSEKQSQEVMFSRKTTKKVHPKMFFNNIPVSERDCQKHLRLHLGPKLSFNILVKTILTKMNRTIALLRNFNKYYLE